MQINYSKNNGNIEIFIEYKIDCKVTRNEGTKYVGETNSREKPPPEISKNFHEIQINFHESENDSNQENQLIATETDLQIIIMIIIIIANNNNEDNCIRNNGSNIENCIRESTVKSKQGKLAFIVGGRMVKDVNSYLLTGSINRKFIEKVRPFSSAKIIEMENYTKPTKRDFNTQSVS